MLRTLPVLLLLASVAPAADWPQFLGPNRDSTTPDKFPAWTDKPKEVWKKPVGEAHSSPVVANGLVYVFAKVDKKEAEQLTAFDARTGDEKWTKSYERGKVEKPLFGAGPRGTPTVDGERVYTYGRTGVLTCWDAKTGEPKWQTDMLKEFGADNITFGVSTSPTVVGKNVVVMVGGKKGAGIVGMDKETGRVTWQATNDGASYASPIVVGDKTPELVFLTAAHVRAVNADSGKEVWKHPFVDALLESSTTPVKVGDLYVVGSVKSGSIGVRVKGAEVEQVWKNEKLTCYFSTPVVVGDYLYMVNGEAKFPGGTLTMRCVEAKSGKVMWEKADVGTYHAAFVKTGDGKLLLHDDKGHLKLLEPNEKGYKELASSKVCGTTWAHPAISDGKVYLRDEKTLYCLQVGSEK